MVSLVRGKGIRSFVKIQNLIDDILEGKITDQKVVRDKWINGLKEIRRK